MGRRRGGGQYGLYLPHSTPFNFLFRSQRRNHWVLCYMRTPHPSGLCNKDLTTAHRIENKSLITIGLFGWLWRFATSWRTLGCCRWKIFMVEYFWLLFDFFSVCVCVCVLFGSSRWQGTDIRSTSVLTQSVRFIYISRTERFAAGYENVWSFCRFVCKVFRGKWFIQSSLSTKTTVDIALNPQDGIVLQIFLALFQGKSSIRGNSHCNI